MSRNDAIKRFHEGGDGLADLIGDGQPVELPVPDTDQAMVSRSVRLLGRSLMKSPSILTTSNGRCLR